MMTTHEKLRPALQCQTDQKKINSRLIISHYTDVKSTHLFGFIGSVGVFRQFIEGQRILLDVGIILP